MSSRTDLVPAGTKGRPAVLTFDGCHVHIWVHDQNFEKTLKHFRNRLKEFHPDNARDGYERRSLVVRFRRVLYEREQWFLKEKQWYSQFGLETPASLPVLGLKSGKTFYKLELNRRLEEKRRRKHAQLTAGNRSDAPVCPGEVVDSAG